MTNRVSRTITDQTLSRIITIESAGRPAAKAATSSATGLFQFLNATWLGTVQKHNPSWARGVLRPRLLAMRKDPEKSIEMGARFTEDNARALGTGFTDGDLYLAHFLGIVAARKVFRANQGAPVEPLVGASAVRANRSILQGKTVAQVRAWAARKMAAAGRTNWIDRYWTQTAAPSRTARVAPAPETDEADTAEPVKVEDPFERSDEEEPVDEETPLADPAADPVAAPPPGPTSVEIEVVQRQLADMGYWPGAIDGIWGGVLAGAIAGFKNDRHVTGGPVIDAALTAAIEVARRENFKRPISQERATATESQLAPRVEAVRETGRSRFVALWTAVMTGVGSFFGWIVDQFETIQQNSIVQKVVGMFGTIPWYLWFTGFMGVLVFIWQSQRKAGQSVVNSYNEGRLIAGEPPKREIG